MTLPVVPGSPMSFSQINTELGLTSTAQISLNDSAVRTLAGVGASPAQIAITNLSGKSNQFAFTISSNQTNANLRTLAVNAGWAGTSKVVATVNSGVYISSNGTGTPALTINGSFPNGVQLINNGVIVGMGGNGGMGGGYYSGWPGQPGSAGGPALSVSVATSITNNNTIAGGGGGGGGSASYNFVSKGSGYSSPSGGGGGGQSSAAANSSGGAGGVFTVTAGTGSPGTLAGPGIGGPGSFPEVYRGATGGVWGSTGGTGANNVGYQPASGGAGGAGGASVSGNSNVTWLATGTRYGPLV